MAFSVEQALGYFRRAQEQGRLAHAFLLVGAEGSGKRQLVRDYFAVINGVQPGSGHPDLHEVEPESKSRRIVVDQIRRLEAELRMKSGSVPLKFGIILDADRLMPQAANAFLKTLEEPPENSILFLITALPEALLDTIRSRCLQITLQAPLIRLLAPGEKALLDAVVPLLENPQFTVGAGLTIARILQDCFAAEKSRIEEEHEGMLRREEGTYKQTTEGKWLEQLEERLIMLTESRYTKARTKLALRLIELLGDAARLKFGSPNLDLPEYQETSRRIAAAISLPELLRRIHALEGLPENLSRNVQEALALEVACLDAFGPEIRKANRAI